MKNSITIFFGVITILVATVHTEIKAQDCGCGAALIKDKIESSDEGFEYYHFLEEIDEYQYEQIKKSASANGKYKLIKGSANYSEFREKVNESIRRTETETGLQYKSNYYEVRTNPIAYEYWGKCMESCNKIGLILWIQNESKSSLALLLKYKAGPHDPTSINYIVTIQHGNGTIETIPGKIVANGTEPIAIKRKCASENGISQTTMSVKGAGYSSDWITSKFHCGSIIIPPPNHVLK